MVLSTSTSTPLHFRGKAVCCSCWWRCSFRSDMMTDNLTNCFSSDVPKLCYLYHQWYLNCPLVLCERTAETSAENQTNWSLWTLCLLIKMEYSPLWYLYCYSSRGSECFARCPNFSGLISASHLSYFVFCFAQFEQETGKGSAVLVLTALPKHWTDLVLLPFSAWRRCHINSPTARLPSVKAPFTQIPDLHTGIHAVNPLIFAVCWTPDKTKHIIPDLSFHRRACSMHAVKLSLSCYYCASLHFTHITSLSMHVLFTETAAVNWIHRVAWISCLYDWQEAMCLLETAVARGAVLARYAG